MTDMQKDAFRDYQNGMKYPDIARKYGVSLSAVKQWAARYWKAETVTDDTPKRLQKNVTDVTEKDKRLQPKSRGAQIGNGNAVGNNGGAPKGNNNNFKHGAYSSVYWDTLSEDEYAMLHEMDFGEEAQLTDQIKLLTVRERRLLKLIQDKKDSKGGLSLDSVIQRKLEIKGNLSHGESQTENETTTKTVVALEFIMKLESELTRVQSRKTRCIEALSKLRLQRQRLAEEQNGDEAVNEWVSIARDEY